MDKMLDLRSNDSKTIRKCPHCDTSSTVPHDCPGEGKHKENLQEPTYTKTEVVKMFKQIEKDFEEQASRLPTYTTTMNGDIKVTSYSYIVSLSRSKDIIQKHIAGL